MHGLIAGVSNENHCTRVSHGARASCDTLDIKTMAKAAANLDTLCEYLSTTGYSQAADMLKTSPSSFERWCDNEMIEQIKPQKYESFSIVMPIYVRTLALMGGI